MLLQGFGERGYLHVQNWGNNKQLQKNKIKQQKDYMVGFFKVSCAFILS